MEFSFILLTWNSERYIGSCIDSIIAEGQLLNEPFEIHIVDNGSSDSTAEKIHYLAQLHPGIIYPIFLSTNLGTTRSRNMALRKATGRYIVVLDSDIQLLPGVTIGLLETLQKRADVGVVAPRLIYPDGRHQKSVDIFPTLTHKIKRFLWLKKMECNEAPLLQEKGAVEVDYAISAMWMLPKATIEKVGLLDENIFYSPEDVDYCLRIWKSGLKVIYDPKWTAIHDAQEISRGWRIRKSTILHVFGLLYFFKKHRYYLRPPVRINRSIK